MYNVVVNPYRGKASANRPGLMLTSAWTDACAQFVRRESITALYLNSSKGWTGTDCRFLESVPQIEELSIIAPKVTGLEALRELPGLVELEITTSTSSEVDFTLNPRLERAYLYWWPGAASLFESGSLRRVHLDKLPELPVGWSSSWHGMREFTLANSATSDISEVRTMSNLGKLQLLNLRRLIDFSPIESLDLRWLAISGCKQLSRLDILSKMRNLEVLLLDDGGGLESLRPLASLKSLKAFWFAGATSVVDGDLGVLADLPELSMLGFASRRHYTHKLVKPWSWSNFGQPDRLLEMK